MLRTVRNYAALTLSGRLSHLVGHYNFPVVVECPTWCAIYLFIDGLIQLRI